MAVPMSVQDELWLTMDRPNNLMVVDGAMIMRGPLTLEQVRTVYEVLVERFPVFARRARKRGRNWVWEDDPDFSLDNHISEVELPEPADLRALQEFVGARRSEPLAMERPRWESFLIPHLTLADGAIGSAVVSRFHHSIADGVRLTQVMLGMCETADSSPEALVKRKSPSEISASAGRSPLSAAGHFVADVGQGAVSTAAEATGAALHAIRHPRSTLAGLPSAAKAAASRVTGAARSGQDLANRAAEAAYLGHFGLDEGIGLIRHPDRLLDALEVLGIEGNRSIFDASSLTKIALAGSPETVWSGKVGTTKAVAWSQPIPLAPIKEAGRAVGATVNDVLLAGIAGGLRRYLEERSGLVDEVTWMVPVNLKPFAENLPEDLGNYFAVVFLPMALHHEDREQRLAQMNSVMNRIKQSDEAVLTFGLQRIVSMSPSQMAYFLTNFFANKAVGVLTNVPGPRSEMTFSGVPVDQVVGFAPCSGDQPMTATIFSYNGGVTMGFATDANLVPDPELLCDYVVAEVQALIGAG